MVSLGCPGETVGRNLASVAPRSAVSLPRARRSSVSESWTPPSVAAVPGLVRATAIRGFSLSTGASCSVTHWCCAVGTRPPAEWLVCGVAGCGQPLRQLVQLHCPIPGAHRRTLHVLACRRAECTARERCNPAQSLHGIPLSTLLCFCAHLFHASATQNRMDGSQSAHKQRTRTRERLPVSVAKRIISSTCLRRWNHRPLRMQVLRSRGSVDQSTQTNIASMPLLPKARRSPSPSPSRILTMGRRSQRHAREKRPCWHA